MLNKLQTLRDERNDEKGFTLIELLVVVVIIGILIAIAIPLYLNYQKGAKNKSVQSDTRNAIAVVEQCYTDTNNTYPTTGQTFTAPGGAVAGCSTVGSRINVSDGNTLTYTLAAGVYTINTVNADTNKSYTYNSGTGVTTHN